MEYIKLKLGQNIYRYGEHVANHKINKKHLWLLNDRGSYSEIEGFYCDLCQRVYVKDSELVYLKRQFNGYQFNVNSIKENGITKYVKGGFKLSFYSGLKMYDLGGLRIDRCQAI